MALRTRENVSTGSLSNPAKNSYLDPRRRDNGLGRCRTVLKESMYCFCNLIVKHCPNMHSALASMQPASLECFFPRVDNIRINFLSYYIVHAFSIKGY